MWSCKVHPFSYISYWISSPLIAKHPNICTPRKYIVYENRETKINAKMDRSGNCGESMYSGMHQLTWLYSDIALYNNIMKHN